MNTINKVPCNGCKRCCINDAVRILPHEDANKWKTEPHPMGKGMRMLAHKPDGGCHYLGDSGCTIQHDKPQICGEMDCRKLAEVLSFTKARQYRIIHVWRQGKELLSKSK